MEQQQKEEGLSYASEDILECAKKAFIGKYFVMTKDGLGYFGKITNVRWFCGDYSIEIKWREDSTRRLFYFSEEDIKALLACSICTRKDKKTIYILHSEVNFTSCISKQVVSAENAHTNLDAWKERWFEMFYGLVVKHDAELTTKEMVDLTNHYIKRVMQEMDKFFNDLEEKQ